MATQLEIKRIKSELSRVIAAKDEMDFRIHERLEEIDRLKANMNIQEAKELELIEKIKEMESAKD
jgi:hypothetical protein